MAHKTSVGRRHARPIERFIILPVASECELLFCTLLHNEPTTMAVCRHVHETYRVTLETVESHTKSLNLKFSFETFAPAISVGFCRNISTCWFSHRHDGLIPS